MSGHTGSAKHPNNNTKDDVDDNALLHGHFCCIHAREMQGEQPYGSTSSRVNVNQSEERSSYNVRKDEDVDESEYLKANANELGYDDSELPSGEGNGCIYDVDGKDPHPLLRRFFAKYDPVYGSLMKWVLSLFLLIFLSIIIVGMLYSGVHYQVSGNTTDSNNSTNATDSTATESSETDSSEIILDVGKCKTKFGSILGVHQGVFAYSNCNDVFVSSEDSMLTLTGSEEVYAGLRWQCVEYARRYWLLAGTPERASFGSVNGAADIWSLTKVTTVANGTSLPMHRFTSMSKKDYNAAQQDPSSATNTITNTVPRVGDIIIYHRELPSFPFGHVAVIVAFVAAENATASTMPYILVGEQNWSNEMWPFPYHNYSRQVNMTYDANRGEYSLLDVEGTIYGWMRYG